MNRAPHVLYGVKYIDLVALTAHNQAPAGQRFIKTYLPVVMISFINSMSYLMHYEEYSQRQGFSECALGCRAPPRVTHRGNPLVTMSIVAMHYEGYVQRQALSCRALIYHALPGLTTETSNVLRLLLRSTSKPATRHYY